jgi:hypothetical protein
LRSLITPLVSSKFLSNNVLSSSLRLKNFHGQHYYIIVIFEISVNVNTIIDVLYVTVMLHLTSVCRRNNKITELRTILQRESQNS